MSLGIFADKAHKPSPEEIANSLGSKQSLWDELTRFFEQGYALPAELTFGGKNYGWNVWYRKNGKALASLYPHKNRILVQIVLGKEQVARALFLPLGKKVEQCLRDTPQFHDGRWLLIPVTTRRDVKDIEQLVQLKRRVAVSSPQ